jgi:hypothetical protein
MTRTTSGLPTEPSTEPNPFHLMGALLAWPGASEWQQRMPLSGDVSQWIRAWGEAVGQIGLLNINYAGSSDPGAERRISSRYSYGRQLGRIMEVLAPLVKSQEAQCREIAGDDAVKEFLEMADKIAAMKQPSVDEIVGKVRAWRRTRDFKQRLDGLISQLEALKNSA